MTKDNDREDEGSKRRVIIIEDNTMVSGSFEKTINRTNTFTTVGNYLWAEEALAEVEETRPDIALVDITLPGMSGIEVIPRLKAWSTSLEVVVVTVHENSEYVFQALCAGAVGYLTKSVSPERLIEALKQTMDGGAPMSVQIARKVVAAFQRRRVTGLNDREHRVLELLAQGRTYATIGAILHVSHNTIKYHVRNIYDKLQVSCKEEALKVYRGSNEGHFFG